MYSFKKSIIVIASMFLLVNGCGSSSGNEDAGGTLGDNETVAVIPDSVVGTYEYIYHESVTGSGIVDETLTTFVIGNDGTLTIDGSTVLSNPVLYRGNVHEVIWFDSTNNLQYAASSLETGIREINVGLNVHYDQPGFVFYGQYNANDN